MAKNGGVAFASDGRLLVTSNASPASTEPKIGGWAFRPSDGAAYYTDLGASAVPATAKFLAGFAFSPAGSIYCTSNSGGSFLGMNGTKVRQDGALFVQAASPSAGDVSLDAFTFNKSTGALYIQVL